MTKISENTNDSDVQMHIQKASDLINAYLPVKYVKIVQGKLAGQGYSDTFLRNVRQKIAHPDSSVSINLENNLQVVLAMAEVARENEELLARLRKVVN